MEENESLSSYLSDIYAKENCGEVDIYHIHNKYVIDVGAASVL